jgi:multicomponent Na+:H+ antiporter subunit D
MAEHDLILLTILIPALGSILIAIAGERYRNVREGISLLSAILLFIVVYFLYQGLQDSQLEAVKLATVMPGLTIAFRLEPLGILFAMIASFLWIITTIFSIGYMRGNGESHQTRFYVCFAWAIASTMGVALSANMFSLFIFYEFLTLTTYPLVTHSGTDEAMRSGRLYLGYLLGTSICLQLFAIVWTWSLTGTLDFTHGGVFAGEFPEIVVTVLFALYIFGIGKAALMPFHRWLPAAMVAPTPVSALLHAVAVVKAGVFTVLKISVYLFGLDELASSGAADWLVFVSGATIIIASVIALQQDNLKARLAYSTISQLSYVIMATVVLAPLSIIGAAMHIAVHALGKITLFFCAGSIYTASKKKNVSQLDGIGHYMPWTMAAFTIGSLSMIGVPPAAGFLSKWYMLLGAYQAQVWTAVTVIVISTLLNAAYFLPIVYAAYFREPPRTLTPHGEAPALVVIALCITAVLTLAVFFYPGPLLELVKQIGK